MKDNTDYFLYQGSHKTWSKVLNKNPRVMDSYDYLSLTAKACRAINLSNESILGEVLYQPTREKLLGDPYYVTFDIGF